MGSVPEESFRISDNYPQKWFDLCDIIHYYGFILYSTMEKSLSPVTLAIEKVILAIPRGKVSTYGRVARSVGLQNGARAVARVLHSRAEIAGLPWFRVLGQGKKALDAKISLTGAGYDEQYALLRAEGIIFSADGTVDLEKYGV